MDVPAISWAGVLLIIGVPVISYLGKRMITGIEKRVDSIFISVDKLDAKFDKLDEKVIINNNEMKDRLNDVNIKILNELRDMSVRLEKFSK